VAISADLVFERVIASRDLAEALFDELAKGTSDAPGVTRAPYGDGEAFAHQLMAKRAGDMGLYVSRDAAANTYMTLRGRDRTAPRVLIGSHLDSVRHGGNFDGAAGVIAGLVATSAIQALHLQPECDITTMGVRAEESAWFQVSYVGSRSALGTLPTGALDAKRIDTNRTLFEHMKSSGGDPASIKRGLQSLDPQSVRAFIELHIEQAPSLVEAALPVGICTAIPGNFRYPNARITGEYGHVGLPRRFRSDAVFAAADFVQAVDRIWEEYESRGKPMACTLGRFHTDTAQHSMTVVPGELHFSIDIRAYDEAQIADVERHLLAAVAPIEARRRVKFDLGQRASAPVGMVDAGLRSQFEDAANQLDIPWMSLGSPGSHDAAAFAAAGVPMAMIFVRNRNGSHNPDEAMEIDDFLTATALLTHWLANHVCHPILAEMPS
jgi:N-carbamoyl-L-amino-acid hydrolase